MRKISIILAAVAMVFAMSSCSGTYQVRTAPTASLSPDFVRVNVDNNQIRCLGEVTVNVNSTVYLGIFRKVHTVNGENYNFRTQKTTRLVGDKAFYIPWVLNRATYKVVETYPQADFYEPAYLTTEKQRMFLGCNENTTMVIRAYQYVR